MLWLGRQTSDKTVCEGPWRHHRTNTRPAQHAFAFRAWLTLVLTWATNGEDKDQTRLHSTAPSGAMLRAASFCWRCQRADVDDMRMIALFAPRPCHVPCQGRRDHNEDLRRTGELLERFLKTGHPVRASGTVAQTGLLQAFCHFRPSLSSVHVFPPQWANQRANYIAVTLSFLPRSR